MDIAEKVKASVELAEVKSLSKRLFNLDFDHVAAVDRDAARILYECTRAISASLVRRIELDKEGREDEPLHVVSGENHFDSAKLIFNALYVQGLIKAGEIGVVPRVDKLVVGLERRSFVSYLNVTGASTTDIKISLSNNRLRDCFDRHNANGSLSLLENFIGQVGHGMAPYAEKVFEHALLKSAVSVRYTDAARQIHVQNLKGKKILN